MFGIEEERERRSLKIRARKLRIMHAVLFKVMDFRREKVLDRIEVPTVGLLTALHFLVTKLVVHASDSR